MDPGIPAGPDGGAPQNLPSTTTTSANNPPNLPEAGPNGSGGPPTPQGQGHAASNDSNAPWIRILTTMWNRRESLKQRVADRKIEKDRLIQELIGGTRLVETIRAQTLPSLTSMDKDLGNVLSGVNYSRKIGHQDATNPVKEQLAVLSQTISDIGEKQIELVRKLKARKSEEGAGPEPSVPGGSGNANQCSSSSAKGTLSESRSGNNPSVDLQVVESTLEMFKKEFLENLDEILSRVLCPPERLPPVGETAGERENGNDTGGADATTGGDDVVAAEVAASHGDGQAENPIEVPPSAEGEVPNDGAAHAEESTSTSGRNNNSLGDGAAQTNDNVVSDILDTVGGDSSPNEEYFSAVGSPVSLIVSDVTNGNDSDYVLDTDEGTETEDSDSSTRKSSSSPTSSVELEGVRRSGRLAAAPTMTNQSERLPRTRTRGGNRTGATSRLKINRKKLAINRRKPGRAAAVLARARLETLFLEEDTEESQEDESSA